MTRILLVPYTESLGHSGRTLELAHALSTKREIEIQVAGGGQFDFVFPYQTVTTPQVPYPILGDWLHFYLPGLPFFESESIFHELELERTVSDKRLALEAMTQRWLEVLAEQAPDLLIVDGRPEVYWAAQVMSIPLFGIVSFVWTELFTTRYGLTSDSLRENDPALLRNFNRIGEKFGQRAVTNCWQPFYGRGRLIADSSMFTGTDLPTGCFSIGPNIWNGMVDCDVDFVDGLAKNGPLVYITSGTSSFSVFYHVARELRDRGIQTVLSGGIRGTRPAGSRQDGSLYICSGIVPGIDLMRRVNVILCHGGVQTLYQAAVAGTLAFVLPQHFDHRRNGTMFAQHGFARLLSNELTNEEVADQIASYLDDTSVQPTVRHLETGSVDVERLVRFLEGSA